MRRLNTGALAWFGGVLIRCWSIHSLAATHSERERVQGRTAETERIRARIIQELRQTQSTRLLQKRRNFDSDAALQEIAMVDDDPSCTCPEMSTGSACNVSRYVFGLARRPACE